jgi:hypothetical protein
VAHVVPFPVVKAEPGTVEGEARCIACKHEWQAAEVFTASWSGANSLECPACGCMRGQYKWPFEGPRSGEVWTCGTCDGQVFMITRQGTRCIGCGKHQVFDG